jgi:hypothetical protein
VLVVEEGTSGPFSPRARVFKEDVEDDWERSRTGLGGSFGAKESTINSSCDWGRAVVISGDLEEAISVWLLIIEVLLH